MTQFQWSSTGREVVEAFHDIVVDKTIVITGASQGGVGAETAFSLAFGNPKHLIIAGRSEQKIRPVIEEINKTNPSIKTTFVQVDLGSQASVRGAAAAINVAVEKIDILINNAAIMACPYTKTEDGIESQFATNYVGHFLLTNLLMEKLLAAGDGTRIVNITSTAGATGEIHLDDINFDDGKSYNPIAAYGQSKLANILFTVSLSKKFPSRKLASFSVHPGSISTGLQKHFNDPATFKECMDYVEAKIGGKPSHFITVLVLLKTDMLLVHLSKFKFEEKKTLQQGCSTTLVAALDPSITDSSGQYLADADIAKLQPKSSVTDSDAAEKLWTLSEKLVGQKFSW